MVKVPSTIYRMCSRKARLWTTTELRKNEQADHWGMIVITKHQACCMPLMEAVNIFQDNGYGPAKADMWIQTWQNRKIALIDNINLNNAYITFPQETLDMMDVVTADENITARKAKREAVMNDLKKVSA